MTAVRRRLSDVVGVVLVDEVPNFVPVPVASPAYVGVRRVSVACGRKV